MAIELNAEQAAAAHQLAERTGQPVYVVEVAVEPNLPPTPESLERGAEPLDALIPEPTLEADPEAAYWDSRDRGNTHEVAMLDAYSIPDLPEPELEL